MSVINNLLSLMNEKGLKQSDLSEALNISSSTVTNWKNRETDPPAKYIIPICEFLCVSPYYLLTGEEKNETLSDPEKELIADFRSLNEKGQIYVQSQVSLAKEVYKK